MAKKFYTSLEDDIILAEAVSHKVLTEGFKSAAAILNRTPASISGRFYLLKKRSEEAQKASIEKAFDAYCQQSNENWFKRLIKRIFHNKK